MPTTMCPSSDQLAAFQAGKLALADLDQIAEHLETCATCATAVQVASTVSDALLRELRNSPVEDAYTAETGCKRAVEEAEALINNGAITVDQTSDAETADPHSSPLPAAGEGLGVRGATLGKYQLLAEIGKGGMGTVYKATHTLLKRTVAVKVLPANRLKDAQAVARFRREIEAAGRLDHPNIVRTHDADESDGQHFLVMEWLDGKDLAKLVKSHGCPSVSMACDYVRQAALGLGVAHQHGLVHRDVKPSNLIVAFVDGKPVVKVLDLGLALLHDAEANEAGESLTSTGQVMGTYDFMAPEQAMETHNVDHRADIYSLGCTFYYLLAGKTPFAGMTETKKLLAHQMEEPAPIERTDIPNEVLAVLKKMMAKDPAQRYQSMKEVADALGEPSGVSRRLSDVSHPAPSDSTGPLRGSARRPVLIASILLGLAAAIALIVGIIRIATPEGDFVIETDDPKIKLSVSKGVVTLHDEATGRTYDVKAVRKASGEYELDVKDVHADLSFKVESLSIKRGQMLALKARFERNQAIVKDLLPPSVDPDRRAAEWVLRIGGNISVKEHGEEYLIGVLGNLPRSAFELTAVRLEGNQKVSDAGLAHFKDCKNLTHLNLARTQTSDEGLVHFTDLKKLTFLHLGVTNVSDVGMVRFKECDNLTVLDLGHTRVSNMGLVNFKNCKSLTRLVLPYTEVNNAGLAIFKHCKDLICLHLSGTQVSNAGMAHFRDCKNITELDLPNTQVTDEGLAHFKDCNLVVLYLGGTQVSNAGLELFKDLKGLTHLGLNGTRVTDAGLSYFKDCEKIRDLRLQDTVISEVGLACFRNCHSLTGLRIQNTKVGSLSPLKGMPLNFLEFDIKQVRDIEILRSIDTLNSINGKPAAEFWAEVDAAKLPAKTPMPRDTKGLTMVADIDYATDKYPTTNTERYAWGTAERQYQMLAYFGGFYNSPDMTPSLAEFVCEAEAKLAKATEGGWGLSFGKDFAVIFNNQGMVRLYDGKEKDGGLAPWVKAPTMNPLTDANVLRIEVAEKRIHVVINGGHALTADLPRADEGTVRLVAHGNARVDARFQRLRAWRLPSAAPYLEYVHTIKPGDHCSEVAFSSDGKFLFTGGQEPLRKWEAETGKFVTAFEKDTPRLAVSADDRHVLAFCVNERRIEWIPLAKPKEGVVQTELDKLIPGFLFCPVAISGDGKRAAVGLGAGKVAVFDINDGRLVFSKTADTGLKGAVVQLAFRPGMNDQMLVFSDHKGLVLWNLTKGQAEATPVKHGSDSIRAFSFLAFSARGDRFIYHMGYDDANWFDLDRLSRKSFAGLKVRGAGFVGNDRWIVTCHEDKKLRLWDAENLDKELMVKELNANAFPAQIAVSPKGDLIAVRCQEGVQVWRVAAPAAPPVTKTPVGEIRRYLGHADGIRFIRPSPDGKSFLAGANGELWLWDIDQTIERVRFPNVQGNIQDAGFSLDGTRIVGPAQVGTVVVWENPADKKVNELARFKIDNWVESAFLLPEKSRVFYANTGGGRIYDLDKKTELPLRFLGQLAVRSKDGKRILSADGRILYLWDADTGKEISNVELPRAPYRIALAPNGKDALAAGHKAVYQWDMIAKKEGKQLEGTDSIVAVAFSPDGKRALTGGYDKKLRLWDLETSTEIHCFHDHAGPVTAAAFLPDGKQALSGSGDKTIRLWQLPEAPVARKAKDDVGEVRTFHGHSVRANTVTFAPDGKWFLSGGDAEIFQWDLDSSKEKRRFVDTEKTLRTARNRDYIRAIAITKDGKTAISGGADQIVRVWDIDKGQVRKYVNVPKVFPPSEHFVALSPDEKFLLVAPTEGFVRLFAFPSLEESKDRFGGAQGHFSKDGEMLLTLEGQNILQRYHLNPPKRTFVNVKEMFYCALSPDGRIAVCGGLDSMVHVWDMDQKKEVYKMAGHKGTIQALVISPNGKRALSGGGDNMVRLWDLTTGKEIRAFEGHGAPVVSVAFSPDGRQALSAGGSDKTIRLWQLPD